MRPGPLFAFAALLLPAVALARVWYVAPSGSTPPLQAVIDSVAAGDTVRVGCGIYKVPVHGDEQRGPTCLTLKSGVAYLGGSDDPSCTVIDAGGTGRCFWVEGGLQRTLIAGLTFRNGAAKAVGGGGPGGGGGYVLAGGAPVRIRHCAFVQNHADADGGGLTAWGSPISITDCVFEENSAEGSGGGLFGLLLTSESRLERCRFSHNRSSSNDPQSGGGGFAVALSILVLSDCAFEANEAVNGAAAMVSRGWFSGSVSMESCAFLHNIASFRAGGIYCLDRVALDMSACRFEDNAGPYSGGAIDAIQRSELNLTDCRFSRNAGARGAAICVADTTTANLTRCVLGGNTGNVGGALAAIGYAQCTLDQCTLSSNTATLNGGVYCHYGARVQLRHSIVAFAAGGEAAYCTDGTSSVVASCSDIFGNAGGDWTAALNGQFGIDGNVQADPLFCDIAGADFGLHSGSPCAPANSGACGLIGTLPIACGTEALEPSSWARIKASFR